jgi:hypothetical protein
VNQENQTALEPHNQILATAANCGHALAREFRSHLCGIERTRQPRIEDLDMLEPTPDELGLEACPHRLYLGQLGHGSGSLAPGVEPPGNAGRPRRRPPRP